MPCARLRATPAPSDSGDLGRERDRNLFAGLERAERLRDSRVAAQHRTSRGSVTVEDLETLRTQDVVAAVVDACTEKHVPLEL